MPRNSPICCENCQQGRETVYFFRQESKHVVIRHAEPFEIAFYHAIANCLSGK